jgi:zinc protease
MGIRYYLGLLTLLVILASPAHAVQRVEEVRAEGVEALLIRDTSLPIFAMEITIPHSGSVADPIGKEGLSYLTARLMTEGAGKWSSTQFHEMLDMYAIDLKVSAGRDSTTISLECLSEHADRAFELLGAMLSSPRFEQVDLDRLRTEHLSDLLQLQESPDAQLDDAFYRTAFSGHPYGRPTYGTAESVTALTRNDFVTFAKEQIAKNDMIISVSGDTDAVALQKLLRHMNQVPLRKSSLTKPDHATLHTQPEPVRVSMAVPQTSIRVALQGIARSDERFYAAYVMNYLLGGGSLTSRLANAVRKERGLTYSISSNLAMSDYSEWISVNFATKKASADEALKVTLATIKDTATKGFSAGELAAAKDYLTGAFPLATDSNSERVNYLTVMQQYGLGMDYLEKRNTLIEAVTLQQLNDTAKTLLSTDNQLVILTGE